MASLLFPGAAATGFVLLPLMLYHALQIVLASSMAQGLGRRAREHDSLASAQVRSQ